MPDIITPPGPSGVIDRAVRSAVIRSRIDNEESEGLMKLLGKRSKELKRVLRERQPTLIYYASIKLAAVLLRVAEEIGEHD